MKLQNFSKASAARSLLLLAVGGLLFSFNSNPGRDTFTIYMDEQLILSDAVLPVSSVKTITLPPVRDHSMLKVQYSHCGKTGTDRRLSVRDSKNATLKLWNYKENADMAVRAKELAILGTGSDPLSLVYSSSEIPEGRVLVQFEKPALSNALTTGQ